LTESTKGVRDIPFTWGKSLEKKTPILDSWLERGGGVKSQQGITGKKEKKKSKKQTNGNGADRWNDSHLHGETRPWGREGREGGETNGDRGEGGAGKKGQGGGKMSLGGTERGRRKRVLGGIIRIEKRV